MMSASTENPSVLKDALAAFGTAIKFNANEPKYIASRANTLFQIARYKEALADIDKAILLSPDNPDLLAMKAKMTSSRREM
jgi:tetratricopeptide (TPR) repeat protein